MDKGREKDRVERSDVRNKERKEWSVTTPEMKKEREEHSDVRNEEKSRKSIEWSVTTLG